METTDTALLGIRIILGMVMAAHGWNHAFGPGGLEGTARWFSSMGMKRPRVQASMSALVEISAGIGLILGLFTPLMTAALISVALVAGVTAHRRNGFFIFRDGYEYVLLLGVLFAAVALAGPGAYSLDHVIGIQAMVSGWLSFAVALVLGVGGAGLLLAVFWRPVPVQV